MKYELLKTEQFEKWLAGLRDKQTSLRIVRRLDAMAAGSFGDYKAIGPDLFELRLFFGPGYRVYFTIQGREIVFLLIGGDKSTQTKDIIKAKELLQKLED